MCLISPMSCFRLMNERRSLHHSQCEVVCRNFFGFKTDETLKIRIAYRQRRSNFPRGGRKRKIGKCVFSGFAFLAAESENRQLKDLPQADLGRAPERFLLSVRTNSITDNFVYWKWGSLFVFVVIWNTCLILKFIEIFKFWALLGYLLINFWMGVSYTWITNLRVSAFLNSWSLCNA